MMAYIFNAMTHLALDVRLMAFKFFDLVVQFFPSSFSLYAEKVCSYLSSWYWCYYILLATYLQTLEINVSCDSRFMLTLLIDKSK